MPRSRSRAAAPTSRTVTRISSPRPRRTLTRYSRPAVFWPALEPLARGSCRRVGLDPGRGHSVARRNLLCLGYAMGQRRDPDRRHVGQRPEPGRNDLLVYSSVGGQIKSYGVNTAVTVKADANASSSRLARQRGRLSEWHTNFNHVAFGSRSASEALSSGRLDHASVPACRCPGAAQLASRSFAI